MKKNTFYSKPIFTGFLALLFIVINVSIVNAQDTDNDGIADSVDLDDDNDGILDTEECSVASPGLSVSGALPDFVLTNVLGETATDTYVTSGNILLGGASIAGTNNTILRNGWAANGVSDGDQLILTQNFELPTSGLVIRIPDTAVRNSDVVIWTINYTGSTANGILVDNNDKVNTGTGTPNVYDPSSTAATPVFANTTVVNGFQFVLDNDGDLYEAVNASGEGTNAGNAFDFEITLPNGITSFTITGEIETTNGTFDISGESLETDFANAVLLTPCDTDNDGIRDDLDTDSDNDGCPDALEGAGSFTEANVDSNEELTGAVDPTTGVPTATDVNNGQGTAPAVTDENDFSSCADSDGDGILDSVDLDDDNDGIPDTEENISCITTTDLNTPGFATNTDLTSGPSGTADLDGFDNGLFDFFASLEGAATWDDGVQIQNNPAIGDFIFTQPRNTGAAGDVATYEYTFPTAVANFSFVTGGLNNNDEVTITARVGGVDIPIGPDNFGNLVQGIEVSGNTVTGTVFDNSFDPLINVFTTIIPGLVDTITITSRKGDAVNTQVTIGMYSFGYCIVDEFADFDGDGVPNSLDLDSDNDGITDILEAGGTDTDNDGEVDYPTPGDPSSMTDTDMNGLEDGVEATPLTLPNSDALGGPDWLDIDADNDGIPDNVEAQPTSGYVPPSGIATGITDANMNGVDDAYENGTVIGITPENTDGDADPDYVDDDSDNDGIPDIQENGETANTILGVDTDNDGLDDNFDDSDDSAIPGATVNDGINPPNASNLGDEDGDLGTGGDVDYRDSLDTDEDNIPDTVDVDDDNDGIADVDENPAGIDPSADNDGDGVPNYLDDDSNNASIGNDDGLIEDGFDFDNDGIPNHFDIDSDNDGITDVVETDNGDLDTDNDGDIDAADGQADGNNDGQADNTAGTIPVNTDTNANDGPDFLDIDADDDGIVDNIEGQNTFTYNPPLGTDNDSDGLDDQYDTDFAGNNAFTPVDLDGDDTDDFRDLDTDNDGIPDLTEGWDIDGDGTPETVPSNSDADGDGLDDAFDNDDAVSDPTNGQVPTDFPDVQQPGGNLDWRQGNDIDGDGVNDDVDLDNDNDGIPDLVEGTDDTDGDGIPDFLDLDSDNDGIPDITEAGGTDADGDGQIDYPTPGDPMSLNDVNNDGLDDDVAATPLPDTDSDNDGLVDRLDLDSDNDGITDIIEAGGTDTDGDGQVDYATPGDPTTILDVDGDGFIDTIDTDDNTVSGIADGGTALPDEDTDGDGLPNRLDLDSDNDGIHDVLESGGTDTDSNGTADDDDDNVDNTGSNGIPTSAGGGNTPIDTGADGTPDYLNLDSDGDGCSDANEAYASATADGGDGGQFGTGTPAATDASGLVTAATYDTGAVASVIDATDATACDVLDSDGDGVLDDQEIADGTDLNDPCDFVIASITETQTGAYLAADCDGDGVDNGTEIADGTNPEDPCDFDPASITLVQSGDYLISDCDGDGVTNGTEITDGTNPDDPCDFIETSITLDQGGDYLLADCDGDTIPNGQEVTDGTDPNDPCSSNGGTPPAGTICDVTIESDLVAPGLNNDIFQINNIENFPNNTVRIYNRWGVLVFETQGYDNAGNAFRGISEGRVTINKNDALPVGIYFYIIEYVNNGNAEVIDGYLYVNR